MSRQNADELLVELFAKAQGNPLDFVLLRTIIEEASESGAARALAALGLQDERARRDMDELRELLGAWRDVKRSAWQTIAGWVTRFLLALLMIGLAYKMNILQLLER